MPSDAAQSTDTDLGAMQAGFVQALLDANQPAPPDVSAPSHEKRAIKRFAVYRNNVMVSLTEALMVAFPTVLALLGEDYFRALARLYIAQHPPQSAMLATYGDSFGPFLDAFEPLAELPYLGDIARLEQLIRQAYHAADAIPLDPARLQQVPQERLGELVVTLHPAARLLSSKHPVYSIWSAHKAKDPAQAMADLIHAPEDILVTRPQWDVMVTGLPPGGHAFACALARGDALATAATIAATDADDFDLGHTLGTLFDHGALADCHLPL